WGDLYADLASAGIPYAVSIHGVVLSELETSFGRARRRAKWGVAGASLLFANGRWMAEQIQKVGVPAERIAVVYLALDPGVGGAAGGHVAALRSRLGLEGKRAIVSVARITPRKNHDALLRALASLGGRHKDLVYVVVGDGHARPALEAEARRLGVAESVRFV